MRHFRRQAEGMAEGTTKKNIFLSRVGDPLTVGVISSVSESERRWLRNRNSADRSCLPEEKVSRAENVNLRIQPVREKDKVLRGNEPRLGHWVLIFQTYSLGLGTEASLNIIAKPRANELLSL